MRVLDEENADNDGNAEPNSNGDKDELLQSLEDIEPQPYFGEFSILDDNDSLALLSSDLLDLFSDGAELDPDVVAVTDDESNEAEAKAIENNDRLTEKEEKSPMPSDEIRKEEDNLTNWTSNTSALTNNSNPVVDSLPDIDINFGDDPFLINSNQLQSVFDVVDEDINRDEANTGKENIVENDANKIGPKEGKLKTFDEADSSQQQEPPNEEAKLLQHPIVEDIDLETEELYNQLANMSLNGNTNVFADDKDDGNKASDPETENLISAAIKNQMKIDTANDSAVKPKKKAAMDLLMEPTDAEGADILPFSVCQPCSVEDFNSMASGNNAIFAGGSLESSLPPISEDPEASEREREQQVRDLKALYAASNWDNLPPLDHSDPLLRELEAQYHHQEMLALQMHHEEQQLQQEEEYARVWNSAKHWANAFGVDLDKAHENKHGERKITPSKDTSKQALGHRETVFGVSFSDDGKYFATACQDATIGIWDVATNRLVKSLKGHDKKHECLRVDWAKRIWAEDILDRSSLFANLIASSGADGTVKLWACRDKEGRDAEGRRCIDNEWECQYTLDHANLADMGSHKHGTDGDEEKSSGENEDFFDAGPSGEDDKPQVYALQFIDHWDIFKKFLNEQTCARHIRPEDRERMKDEDGLKNSFLMTSSDEFIHLWEIESHAFDKQLKLDDHKIRVLQDKMKLKEVMSLHFGPLDEYSNGVTACSVTGTGMRLPPPPTMKSELKDDKIAFGGPRNPENKIFVFDAAYCPGSGLLGVALADGSLRLVNGRGACVSVIQLPGNESSHLTSFCWDKSGSRLATCVATGHLVTWLLDVDSIQGGGYNTAATCMAVMEGGHQSGRPLYGSRFCGEDESLLLSWGVDGKICMWYSQAYGNIYDPIAVVRDDNKYPIYAVGTPPSERNLVVGGGPSDGGFIGIPLHFYDIPSLEK